MNLNTFKTLAVASALMATAATGANAQASGCEGFAAVYSVQVSPGNYESGYVRLTTADGIKIVHVGNDWAFEQRFAHYVDIEGARYCNTTRESGSEN